METRMNLSILTTSNLPSSKTETQFKDDKEDRFETGYALIIISIVIVIGNSFVLWTVKSFTRRLVADIFISCLALLDIIHTITSIVLAIVFKWTFLQETKEFGILCKIQGWFTVTTQTHSAFIVTLINLERLTAVSQPFFYKSYVNPRRAVKVILILLSTSILVSSLPLIAWGNYVLLPKMALCMFSHNSDYAILILVIGYADLLIVSYCFMAIKVSLKKFVERQARFVARRGGIVDLQERGVALTKTASHSFLQSQRMIKVTAMVSGLFYFSWLPLLITITRAQVTNEPSHLLTLISSLQPLASPLANPLIYFFTWERYKKSYIRILKRLIRCLAKDGAIFNKGSNSTIARSCASQLTQTERESNKSNKKQTQKAANIETAMVHLNNRSINDEIPTLGSKQRSLSYDSSISSPRLTSPEANRRCTFSSESIAVEKELPTGKNMQHKEHTRHEIKDEMKNTEDVSNNVIDKYQPRNSFSNVGKLNKNYREDPWLSQKSSSKNNQKTMEECEKVNYGTNTLENDEVCASQLKNYVHESSSVDKNTERSQDLGNKCVITQRINQYLTNVVNEEELQNSKKERETSKKHQECTKKRNGSNSRKVYEYSSSKHQHRRTFSRKKPTQLHSRNRRKCSQKNYWEEFEDFRKKLDDDVSKCNKSDEREMDYIHETFDSRDTCDNRETSDQFILRILPKSNEYSRRGNKGYLNSSKKRNYAREQLKLDGLSKSPEASIWSYL